MHTGSAGWILVLAVGGLVLPAQAKAKKDQGLPQLFCQARYVYVQTFEGDPLNVSVVPEDRSAANELTEQLQAWKRYVLVNERHEADLVFVVRTGRAATAEAGNWHGGPAGADQDPAGMGQNPRGMGPSGPGMNPGGQGPGTPNSIGVAESGGNGGVGGAVGPKDDLLAIYEKPGNVQTQEPLWRRSLRGGLGPNLPLFEQVKSAVDAACKAESATGGAAPAK